MRTVIIVGSILVAMIIAALALSACTPRRSFRKHMGFDLPETATELCTYSDYRSIDPAYFYRFHVDQEAMSQLLLAFGVRQDREPRDLKCDRSLYRGTMPEWWTPEEIGSPQTWTYDDGAVIRRLRVNAVSGLVYAEVLYY